MSERKQYEYVSDVLFDATEPEHRMELFRDQWDTRRDAQAEIERLRRIMAGVCGAEDCICFGCSAFEDEREASISWCRGVDAERKEWQEPGGHE